VSVEPFAFDLFLAHFCYTCVEPLACVSSLTAPPSTQKEKDSLIRRGGSLRGKTPLMFSLFPTEQAFRRLLYSPRFPSQTLPFPPPNPRRICPFNFSTEREGDRAGRQMTRLLTPYLPKRYNRRETKWKASLHPQKRDSHDKGSEKP
jgi:hypothetical protein